jgi:Ser/Thr protein kinase RdoA (MazF antagonist)
LLVIKNKPIGGIKMYKEQFPVQFSVLSCRAIEEIILSKYLIKRPFKCQFFTQGLNDIFVVNASEDTYYLRVSIFNWRTKEEIEAEVDLLNKLHKSGISVAIPIRDIEGKYIHEILAPEGLRYAVLFTEAKGGKNDNPNCEQNYLLGHMVAEIHAYTDKIALHHKRFDIDLKHLVDEPLEVVKPHLSHRLSDYEYLQDAGHQVKALVNAALSKSNPEYGICHGDIHHGNIHFGNNGMITLFDFDCFGYGWRAYDIAVYLWHQQLNRSASEKDDSKQKQWEAFLSGYNAVRQLSENELKTINAFVAIRDIWLLGIQLGSLERNRGCDWLSDGYFDFHVAFIKNWIRNNNVL